MSASCFPPCREVEVKRGKKGKNRLEGKERKKKRKVSSVVLRLPPKNQESAFQIRALSLTPRNGVKMKGKKERGKG